jgi:hypothetical protein
MGCAVLVSEFSPGVVSAVVFVPGIRTFFLADIRTKIFLERKKNGLAGNDAI